MKNPETTNNIITNAFNKWADKKWFQGLVIFTILWMLVSPVVSPLVSSLFQKETVSESVNTTLDERETRNRESHKVRFEEARQAYALAKHKMQDFVPLTKAEYIFLIEFHNGAENVMTGIQFCRFDMTLEVSDGNSDYVPIEKFRGEIVARYDILLSDELGKNKLLYYTQAEFEKVDRYLAYQMSYVDAKSYAVLNLKDKDGKIFGAVLCISTDDEQLDLLAVRELSLELEDIFNKNTVD